MPSKNLRINVTFEESTVMLLQALALQEHKSVASLVRKLAIESLEKREDLYLSKIAEKQDKATPKTHLHEDVWK